MFGYSSHDADWMTCIAALTKGISYLERHITKNKLNDGLDHSSSSDELEFRNICAFAKKIDKINAGNGPRVVNSGESINKQNLGKDPYMNKGLSRGSTVCDVDVVWRSPQVGLSRYQYAHLQQKLLCRDASAGHPLVKSNYCEDLYVDETVRTNLSQKNISLPVRFHDFAEIDRIFGIKSYEFHLTYGIFQSHFPLLPVNILLITSRSICQIILIRRL